MGTIILHAGMPKAGSSTIQRWIRNDLELVRDQLGVEPLVFQPRRDGDSPGGLTRYERGSVNSGSFLFRYLISDRDPSIVSQLTEPLDRYARAHHTVLVTSEAFATLFAELDAPFLAGLENLAADHTLRVAYYVRAQHESLEAAWRQWGFRSERSPSEYVGFRQRLLAYEKTRDGVARLAPHVSFEVRRFPPGGSPSTGSPGTGSPDASVVDDFARTFLGATQSVDRNRTWANPGLPLDVVNALRHAPAGWFWDNQDDNRRLQQVKTLVSAVDIGDSPATRQSRLLLHRYCHDRFAAGNRALADALGWERPDLVPPVLEIDGPTPDLTSLDSLWDCKQTAEQRMVLFSALRSAVATDGAGTGAVTASPEHRLALDAISRFFDAVPRT